MSDISSVVLVLAIVFMVVSLVFVIFIIFHNKKMIEHKTKITEMELERSRQNLRDSIEIQENDLAKLGADLHDELGPTLSAVKLKINSLANGSSAHQEEFAQLKSMLDHTIYNVRTLSHALYPNALKEFGLVNAVNELIKRLSSLTDIRFTVEMDPAANELPYPVQLSLYRIIQEFYNNSLKHSDCTEIKLNLALQHNTIALDLSDNGKGFTAAEKQQEGLGLKNMRMRAEAINATFQLTSEKEKGAILQVRRQLHG